MAKAWTANVKLGSTLANGAQAGGIQVVKVKWSD
jgi:hypothetical protein